MHLAPCLCPAAIGGDNNVEQMLKKAKAYFSDPEDHLRENLRDGCQWKAQDSSHYATYIRISPGLDVHDAYFRDHCVEDIQQIQMTRLCLSSHHL